MELIKIINPENMQPGLSEDFLKANGQLNADLDKFREAQIKELKHQINYLMDNLRELGIKEYRILDPVSNIESLVFQLLPDKKVK